MDYHGRIMNIEIDAASMAEAGKPRSLRFAFKAGHRDARHAAAEIALEAQAEIARLREALDTLTLVVGLTAFKHEGQRAPLQEAMDQARAALAPVEVSE